MDWKNIIKEMRTDDEKDEEWFNKLTPILDSLEEYMKDIDGSPAGFDAFEQLKFHLLSDIGYTGQYEDDDATPMEDAMRSERER